MVVKEHNRLQDRQALLKKTTMGIEEVADNTVALSTENAATAGYWKPYLNFAGCQIISR